MIKYITSSLFYKNNRLFSINGPVTKKIIGRKMIMDGNK